MDRYAVTGSADPNAGPATPADADVRCQVERMLKTARFADAPSLSRFLAYVVDRTLDGRRDEIKEYVLGVEVFDRGDAFDPKIDTIVRVQARRLRAKLAAYYDTEGRDDAVVIELARGRYVPEFRRRPLAAGCGDAASGGAVAAAEASPTLARYGLGWIRVRTQSPIAAVAFAAAVVFAVAVPRLIRVSGGPVTDWAEYTAITDFIDSATAPALSPDGRAVAFIRGGNAFLSRGQIYVKALPDGRPLQLTSNDHLKFAPTFSPDGSRVSYSEVSRSGTVTSWDTWTVSASGGQPSRFMANASGLNWIDPRHVLFSEFKGARLGVVTATPALADERDIYFPANERGMAHNSYLSPDRKSVLIVEMDATGTFAGCRLVPFDSRALARSVGPMGHCRSAAWSPDGNWMYFSVEVAGRSHLWRQEYPVGTAEQITFGPTDEEGVAVAPGGRSLITSIGLRQSAIWIHDNEVDRPLTSEGFAFAPRLSADGRRLFYLFHGSSDATVIELRAMDLTSGRVACLLPGLRFAENDVNASVYDISRDEQEIVFASRADDGTPVVRLARLDGHTPSRLLAADAAYPSFGAHDDVLFVSLSEGRSWFTRVRRDGSGRERISELSPIYNRGGVSPDGRWVVLYSPVVGTVAAPVMGGRPKTVCSVPCRAEWSADGRFFVVSTFDPSAAERTLVVVLPRPNVLPDLPDVGLNVPAHRFAIPGTRVIDRQDVVLGTNPSTYVFVKTEVRRNLYQVPLH